MGCCIIEISYSRVSTYQRCPYQHNLRYNERLRPKAIVRPLTFGKDFHKLLEVRQDKKELSKTIKEVRAVFNDLKDDQRAVLGYDYPDDLKTVFLDYQKVWKDDELPSDTEQRFDIPMGKLSGEKVMFVGVIDEVYDCGKMLGEHKTFGRAPNMSFIIMNTQGSLYCKAVQELYGIMPEKIKWDFIKSETAKYPAWLEKSQRFSEAQNQGITPFSWQRACKERGIVDQKVLDVGKRYEPNISNFFFRYAIDVEADMVNKVWSDFEDTARQIVSRGHKDLRQVITRDCSWCSYFDICYGQFTGADVEYIKTKNYEIKPQEGEEDVESSCD